jgi:xanthine dehydrogenase molybdenum-binding subunit
VQLGVDALELRRKNALRAGDIDPPTRRPVACSGLDECLDRGAASIGWAERRGKGGNGKRRRGIGMSVEVSISGTHGLNGSQEKGTALVKLTEDGSVNVSCGCVDLGTGVKTGLAQICAEVLQVPLEAIDVRIGDTDTSPFDVGSHGNRTLFVPGLAVREAALELRARVIDYASRRMLECDASQVKLVEGHVVAGSRRLTLAEVVNHGHFNNLEFMTLGVAPIANAAGFCAQFAEVEVDTETGQVKVLRIVSAHDVGRAINPMLVRGQIEGGIFHGIALALSEELVVDRQTGQALNPNFMDYRFLTSADVPSFESILVEPVDPNGPFGAKGVAQNSTSLAPAAIANAVADAIGVHVHALPITPERVLAALKEKKQ